MFARWFLPLLVVLSLILLMMSPMASAANHSSVAGVDNEPQGEIVGKDDDGGNNGGTGDDDAWDHWSPWGNNDTPDDGLEPGGGLAKPGSGVIELVNLELRVLLGTLVMVFPLR